MVNFQLNDSTARMLEAQALARGLSVQEYLDRLALANAAQSVPGTTDFDADLDRFLAENPEPLPVLPKDFSRADLYDDHD